MTSRPPSTPRRLLRVAMFATIVAAVLVTGTRINGQAPIQAVSPFEMIGFIQSANLDTPGDVFSGGSLTMNGHVVTVPRYTILQMPAFALSWQEVFALAPLPYGLKGNGQSGLATTDFPAPLATYEVHVQGNRVIDATGDHYIAGLIFIAQQSLNVGQGYINYIDYSLGEMRVGGTLNDPTTGARVRINDPYAKFSKGDPNADVRFRIDEDNPTVRAQTGYPLCLPRQNPFGATGVDDQYCPQRNRPQSAPPAFDTVVGGNPLWFLPNNLIGPDSMYPAPLEIGDYISYSGTLVADPPGASGPQAGPYPLAVPTGGIAGVPNAPNGTYISANTLQANLGFYTQPGTAPVYVAIDVMLMGTGGLNTATAPQEATLRTRVEGFSTDPFGAAFTGAIVGGGGRRAAGGAGTAIDIWAMDVDCSGTETDRPWVQGVASDVGVVFGGAVAGRWRFRPTGGVFLPPPRNLRATMSDPRGAAGGRLITANLPPKPGDTTGTPQGLETGQYNAPIFTYIFPENLVIGGPTIPNNFADFPFLANGSGPYFGADGGATSLGTIQQLSPFPLAPAPSVSCGAAGVLLNPPEVTASGPALVNAGSPVTLTALATDLNVPAMDPVTLSWTGPAGIALSSTSGTPVTFTAPNVAALTPLTFTVTATNSAGLSSSASVTVDVNPAPIVQAGAPSLAVTAFMGASSNTPGSGIALVLPYSVAYATTGVQLVAKATAATPNNGVTISWVKPPAQPNSSALSITGPSNQTNNSTKQTTSWLTFNATWRNNNTGGPGLVAGSAPAAYAFTISARDNKTGATQTQVVTVTVLPPPDVLTAIVTYINGGAGGGKASKLQVVVTTTAPLVSDPNTLAVLSPQFTLTFVVSDPFDPRFGQTVIWDSWAMILGAPTAVVLGYPMPFEITVKSSAGGSITVSSANFRVR